ncbi:biotin/lipoyl-containing protein [Flammeovirga sp. EKP202]|uniref:biotin/lipoyl-containing protein n=1 Tax=Flammeovirga sp. EKP202 TaxID=2770592 RepID=UPI00165F1AAE|nr:acetyl-CoA carboxylase biotin carboxyl carrier protein subunit [Flammeovirga sp. EKP202]MBD0400521.1 acetyl-CoA carboxylase biotin carboxyl carrier protein subunit [Flammeovirga sp. EKP202]
MLNISVNDKVYSILKDKQSVVIDNKNYNIDYKETHPNVFSVNHNGQRFDIEVIASDTSFKNVTLKINGKKVSFEAKTKLDQLLDQLGMNSKKGNQENIIKAPMPGKVLELLCKEGDQIEENDSLIILEAMKMENILKAPMSGIIKKIDTVEGNSVDKGHVLIEIEKVDE